MNSKRNRKYTFCEKKLDLNLDEEIENSYEDNNEDRNSEDYENEYYEQRDYDIPLYDCRNGNGYVFLFEKRSYLGDELKKEYLFHERFQNVQDLMDQNNLQSLFAHIDYQETVKDIHDLKINQFDLNNISNLSLNLSSFEYDNSIHFIQSVTPLQNLKNLKIQIIASIDIYQDLNLYLSQLSKLFSNKTNLNCLQIIVRKHDSYGGLWHYGFEMIFSAQGEIKELNLSTHSLELDVQHLQTIEKLTYKYYTNCQYFLNLFNQFLKKLINLKYLKIEQQLQHNDEIIFFQVISQLKQIKSLILYREYVKNDTQPILQSQSLEYLNISIGNKMIPIKCPNLQYLDINFDAKKNSFRHQNLDYESIESQVSKMNNLKFLKIRSDNLLSQKEYDGLMILIYKKVLKLKRLVKYETEFGKHKRKLVQIY